jgi:sodium-dependent dicarboxylate transporter 2/3/5
MSESTTSPNKTGTNRKIGFWLGIAAFLLILLFGNFSPGQPLVSKMAAVAVLMAIWWISDAIPLAATSLLPLILFPALGIMKGKEVAPVYMNYVIFLFLGGFLIALAMERWNLHKRIALNIIYLVGGSPSLMVLGFMIATAFLSMWISNTATTIMMVAVGLAVIKSSEATFGKENCETMSVALLLGIAYSSSAGGIATLVGTPPNLALVRIFEQIFPGAEAAGFSFSFGQWMLFGVPLAIILLFVIWFLLTRIFFRISPDLELSREDIAEEKKKLGSIRFEESVILVVFLTTAFLWMFRKSIVIGSFTIPGWTELFENGSLIDDGSIAIAMALILFLVPARNKGESEGYGSILDFGVFSKIPWHIILLFGGGFALAKGFASSGLSNYVGSQFAGLEGTPLVIMIGAICTLLTFLTELTSNTATTEMILPILASIAVSIKIHPLFLMIPAALSSSCAFMMPVATPPNAIVFASGRIRISQMVRVGIVINLIGIVLITALFYLLGPVIFGFDAKVMPVWAIDSR